MSFAATNIVMKYNENDVVKCEFTKGELYELRNAVIRLSNQLAIKYDPTSRNRSEKLDLIDDKLIAFLLNIAV
jgi:hypothetical protein